MIKAILNAFGYYTTAQAAATFNEVLNERITIKTHWDLYNERIN